MKANVELSVIDVDPRRTDGFAYKIKSISKDKAGAKRLVSAMSSNKCQSGLGNTASVADGSRQPPCVDFWSIDELDCPECVVSRIKAELEIEPQDSMPETIGMLVLSGNKRGFSAEVSEWGEFKDAEKFFNDKGSFIPSSFDKAGNERPELPASIGFVSFKRACFHCAWMEYSNKMQEG